MLKCSTVDYSTFFSSIHLKIILLLGYGLYGYIVAEETGVPGENH